MTLGDDVNKSVACLCVGLLLGACQTGYQKTSFTGGFDEIKLSEDSYRISVSGNGFTSTERAEEIALLRASELTISSGYDRFIVVGGTGVSDRFTGISAIQTNRIGNSLITTGGDPVMKPKGNIVIRMLRPKDPAYSSGIDAALIDSQLRPKLVKS
jgi:hypothetical protein